MTKNELRKQTELKASISQFLHSKHISEVSFMKNFKSDNGITYGMGALKDNFIEKPCTHTHSTHIPKIPRFKSPVKYIINHEVYSIRGRNINYCIVAVIDYASNRSIKFISYI